MYSKNNLIENSIDITPDKPVIGEVFCILVKIYLSSSTTYVHIHTVFIQNYNFHINHSIFICAMIQVLAKCSAYMKNKNTPFSYMLCLLSKEHL